jgi:hypothetical protein
MVKLQRQYKKNILVLSSWEPREHTSMDYLPENIGTHLAIDEVALSQGELYTIVTNKRLKARKVLSGNCCWH